MDRLQKTPFPRGNSAEILNYLEQLILIQSKEEGYFPISEVLGGYQDVEIENQTVSLQVPEGAISAVLIIEADTTCNVLHRVIRFKENGSDPSSTSGFALGDNDVYSIIGKQNLEKFRMVGVEVDKTHTARVQFFETNQFKLNSK